MTETQVRHITYGCGVITARDGNYICVRFDDKDVGDKVFIYPDAFEKFLSCDDEAFNAQLQIAFEEERKKAEERAAQMKKEHEAQVAEAEKARAAAAMHAKKTRKK
jgi:esterase/lipase superfamily enzyme